MFESRWWQYISIFYILYSISFLYILIIFTLFVLQECLKGTFDFIVQNCVPADNASDHPGLNTSVKPFQFFYQLLQQVQSVIYEDRVVYSPLISKYKQLANYM